MAGPCGNFTRFPILPLPEKRQRAPEAKTVLLRRRLIYIERCVMEMLRRGVYCFHSCRSATMGSTLLAWRAGKMQASSAASRSTNETALKTIGSIAPTP